MQDYIELWKDQKTVAHMLSRAVARYVDSAVGKSVKTDEEIHFVLNKNEDPVESLRYE